MVTLKTNSELALMRQAGQILARLLTELEGEVREGIKTKDLDAIA